MEKKLELFDFIKLLFATSRQKEWDDLSSYEKNKFQFMLNRFMAIQYPTHANALNMLKTNGIGVAEVWRNCANGFYGDKVPNFIYTKTGKSEKENNPLAKIPNEVIDYFCNVHEFGLRELNWHLELDEQGVLDELKYIEKCMNERDKYYKQYNKKEEGGENEK